MFNTDIVLGWGLILEECSPDIEYIHGNKNAVVDTLLELNNNKIKYSTQVE